jgi:two-component system, chemotaxis family, chemotaxis protein CheY
MINSQASGDRMMNTDTVEPERRISGDMGTLGRGTVANVLIVDDDELIRKLITLILETAGYTVVEAVNGKDALNKLNGMNVEMIITDLRMPHMDGMEFIKHLRSKPAYRSVPIVAMTAEFLGYKKKEGEQAGVTDWILKPFLPQQLLHTVKRFAM